MALSTTQCGWSSQPPPETSALANDIEARFHQPVQITISADSQMSVLVSSTLVIDDVKTTKADCDDYAQRIARFALNHYVRPASISYLWVEVRAMRPHGSEQPTMVRCMGGGHQGTLPPDVETPSILMGAGKARHH
jgi:hypothetical protein